MRGPSIFTVRPIKQPVKAQQPPPIEPVWGTESYIERW